MTNADTTLDALRAGLPVAEAPVGPIEVSFEFFPPKTEKMQENLWAAIKRLEPLNPKFVSCTYGAGGSTRERTHETLVDIRNKTNLEPAAHLTCVSATREEVDEVARRYWDAGIRHIVALRGDSPEGMGEKYVPHPGGYAYAADLVAGLKKVADFEISVAAYPEIHPEAQSAEADIDNLKRKLDAGATRAITQYFFNPEDFLRFRDRVAAAGITAPLVPGILPVTNFGTVCRFSAACGASVPEWMHKLFEGLDDDPTTRKLIAATVAIETARKLVSEGAREFHFYTLNRADLTYAICHVLGVRAQAAAEPAEPAPASA
ncbi:5,10-methylenetetrahydrofolate reductase [Caenispirillum salinarum AK4]|uniref:Methylenetetrahydrofolate reductase n=1 Tax=Caenispirillum salinarum AK4 TaxID=1238182 RepID=K9GSU5_9PROT|nr:5,10-methylenetetrahydrofolate reductase [Caenispirillum salinarum AK4]